MNKKINITLLHKEIKKQIEKNSSLKVYDVVETDTPAPFAMVQLVSKRDASTKTMYKEEFNFYIHVLAEGGSSINIYNAIEAIEESLTQDIDVCGLLEQRENGILQIITEQTGEKRAVLSYTFIVCYGYKSKMN